MTNRSSRIYALSFTTLLIISGCSDMGTEAPTTSSQPPPPSPTPEVSYLQQVRPILQRHGCISCHGGSGGLFVETQAQILQGGLHGPAVKPGKADSSLIIQKLSTVLPFGDRMPQGGPYLPDSTIQVIRSWINQGAKNN